MTTNQSNPESVSLGQLRYLDGVPYEIKMVGYSRVVGGIFSMLLSIVYCVYAVLLILAGAIATAGFGLLLFIPLFLIYFGGMLGVAIWSVWNGLALLKGEKMPLKLLGPLGVVELISIIFLWPNFCVGVVALFAGRNAKVKEYLSQKHVP